MSLFAFINLGSGSMYRNPNANYNNCKSHSQHRPLGSRQNVYELATGRAHTGRIHWQRLDHPPTQTIQQPPNRLVTGNTDCSSSHDPDSRTIVAAPPHNLRNATDQAHDPVLRRPPQQAITSMTTIAPPACHCIGRSTANDFCYSLAGQIHS